MAPEDEAAPVAETAPEIVRAPETASPAPIAQREFLPATESDSALLAGPEPWPPPRPVVRVVPDRDHAWAEAEMAAPPAPEIIMTPAVEEAAAPAAAPMVEAIPPEEEEPAAAPEAIPTATLAEIYVRQGLPERALEVYERILAADPSNAEIQSRVRELREILAPAAPAAESEEEPTIAVLPTPTLAEIYASQGQFERALEVYTQVLAGDPDNHEVQARVREISAILAPPGSATERRIRHLEAWLDKIRRAHHVQDQARGGGSPPADV